ncbi:MAG: hypothetical protein ISP94_00385 [SAR86 cluster bacterium]|nr:hypothetical protein [SAR86 cluster bacterium]
MTFLSEQASSYYESFSNIFLDLYFLSSGSFFPITLIFMVVFSMLISKFGFEGFGIRRIVGKDQVFNFFMTAYIALAFAYLIYPNFHDHIESSVSMMSKSLLSGNALYSYSDAWPYSVLVYGPYLFIFEALLLTTGLPIIEASKLLGFLSILGSFILMRILFKKNLSLNMLILILPAGFFLFWNRPEPLIILFTLFSLYLSRSLLSIYSKLLFGFSLGVLVNLKISMLPIALLIFFFGVLFSKLNSKSMLQVISAGIFSLIVPFFSHQIDFRDYAEFIFSVSTEGIDYWILATNFIFFILIIIYTKPFLNGINLSVGSISIVNVLFFLAFIPSIKPGAGIWHLLPIVFISAFIIEKSKVKKELFEGRHIFNSVCMLASVFLIYFSFILFSKQAYWNQVKYELVSIEQEYPGIKMGVTDLERYGETFYRVMLSGDQFDVPAFMDLNFIGQKETEFAEKLSNCTIDLLVLPNSGEPFSLENFYTKKSLYSNETKAKFNERFALIKSFNYYNVYQCAP